MRIEHILQVARDVNKYIAQRSRSDLNTNSMLLRALTNAVFTLRVHTHPRWER